MIQVVDEVRLEKVEPCKFLLTPSAEPNAKEDAYLLMGRCYIDKYDHGVHLEDQVDNGGMTPEPETPKYFRIDINAIL